MSAPGDFLTNRPSRRSLPTDCPIPLEESSLPLLPWEVLEHEIAAHLPFSTQLSLGRTCKRLALKWPQWAVHQPPSRTFLAKACCDERLKRFVNLRVLCLPSSSSTLLVDSSSSSSSSFPASSSSSSAITLAGIQALRSLTSLDIEHQRPTAPLRHRHTQTSRLRPHDPSVAPSASPLSVEVLSGLSKLQSLRLGRFAHAATDANLAQLTALTSLDLSQPEHRASHSQAELLTGSSLASLSCLTELNISGHSKVTRLLLPLHLLLLFLLRLETKQFALFPISVSWTPRAMLSQPTSRSPTSPTSRRSMWPLSGS